MEKSFSDLKADVEAGGVVQYRGRTASTVAELETIKDYPDGSDSVGVMTYDHGGQEVIPASPAFDEVGARSQPFSAEIVTDNKPSADKPGPTTVSTTDTPKTK